MWSKITNHIGSWIGLDDGHHRPVRNSASLTMLHSEQYSTTVGKSKSSDNLFRIGQPPSYQQTNGYPQTPTKKSSVFSFRRGRNKEKKAKTKDVPTTNGHTTSSIVSSIDDISQSYHPTINPGKSIMHFLRQSRSRSSHQNEVVLVSRPVMPSTSCTVADFSHLRRRRPRSAHFDPNTITLPETKPPECAVDDLYRKIERLGEGSYAVVYKCERISDGAIVALKEIKLQFQEGLPFTAIREASLLRALKHANIVSLHDIFHQKKTLTFVFEYMKDDLGRFMEQHPNGLDAFQIKLFLYQLLRGLAFCHQKKILHRDLKPQNLLINEAGELKLADFGLARAKSVPSRTFSHEVVTMWYRPPDVLLGSTDYSTSLDIWGVGCIFAEMCTGTALFPGRKDVIDQLEKIFRIRGAPDSRTWPEVLQLPHYLPNIFPQYEAMPWCNVDSGLMRLKNGEALLTSLLQLNPADRISACSAMLHPYFSNLPTAIHLLPPTTSIFTLPQLQPLYR